MGWKTINGGRYYYQCRRVSGRVLTEYVPVSIAQEAAVLDSLKATDSKTKRDRWRARVREMAALDEAVILACSHLEILASAELILAGFHKHKRQWRRLRKRA